MENDLTTKTECEEKMLDRIKNSPLKKFFDNSYENGIIKQIEEEFLSLK